MFYVALAYVNTILDRGQGSNTNHINGSLSLKCTIKIFRGGEGVVDGEGVAVKDA